MFICAIRGFCRGVIPAMLSSKRVSSNVVFDYP